jgi:hypothetical protein
MVSMVTDECKTMGNERVSRSDLFICENICSSK